MKWKVIAAYLKGFKKYKQLIDSTIVVMIAMVLLGAYVATIDFAMRQFMTFLTTGFWSGGTSQLILLSNTL